MQGMMLRWSASHPDPAATCLYAAANIAQLLHNVCGHSQALASVSCMACNLYRAVRSVSSPGKRMAEGDGAGAQDHEEGEPQAPPLVLQTLCAVVGAGDAVALVGHCAQATCTSDLQLAPAVPTSANHR